MTANDLAERVARVESFAGIEKEAWDEGVTSTTDTAVLVTTEVLARVAEAERALPAVFPTEDGGVNLEWYSHGRAHATEVTVRPDGTFEYFVLEPSSLRSHKTLGDFIEALLARLPSASSH